MKKSIIMITILSTITSLSAITLKDTIKQTILTNEEINANNLSVKATKSKISQEKSGYYPTLDLEAYLETVKTKTNLDTAPETSWFTKNGGNIALKARQVIYDASNTSNRVKISETAYRSELNRVSWENESILLDIVHSYIDILKSYESKQYSNFLTLANKESLVVAKDKEDISGESLPTQETVVIVTTQIDKNNLEEIKYKTALSNFKKLTSIEAKNLCKPNIDKKLFEIPLKEVQQIALSNNYKILQQQNLVNQQKCYLNNKDAAFRPSLELNVNAAYDDDLILNETGSQKDLNAKLLLKWNLYNGGRDKLSRSEEKTLLQEQVKRLELVKKDVLKRVADDYNQYHITLDRIKNLKDAVDANKLIVKLTNQQLADGTKTFLEEIQAKTNLIDSEINLSDQENELYNKYYNLLNDLSILSKTILLSKDQTCNELSIDNPLITESSNNNLGALINDDNSSDNNDTKMQDTDTNDSKNIYFDFDKNKLAQNLKITYRSFTKTKVNPNDQFRFKLDEISPELLQVFSSHMDQIAEVRIESHTSSEYTKFINKSLEVQKDANIALSQRRGNKVKNYFIKVAPNYSVAKKDIRNKFHVYAMGPTKLITNADGTENRVASRRVEIIIVKK